MGILILIIMSIGLKNKDDFFEAENSFDLAAVVSDSCTFCNSIRPIKADNLSFHQSMNTKQAFFYFPFNN